MGASDCENRLDEDLTVRADPDHVHRIFLNLFRNALQAIKCSEARVLSVEGDAGAARQDGQERIAIRGWVTPGRACPARAGEGFGVTRDLGSSRIWGFGVRGFGVKSG